MTIIKGESTLCSVKFTAFVVKESNLFENGFNGSNKLNYNSYILCALRKMSCELCLRNEWMYIMINSPLGKTKNRIYTYLKMDITFIFFL